MNSSHITMALNMISNTNSTPPSNISSGNIKQVVMQSGIGWSYTFDGIDIHHKGMGMSFGSNSFTFSDSWNFYKISNSGVLSKEEALNIAWNAAQKFNITIIQNGIPVAEKPEWSNMDPEIYLSMIAGHTYNNSLNNELNFANMGNTTRDPLSLYPLWQARFYFNQTITGNVGVQVGVWGDTKEIVYISGFGHHGGQTLPQTTSSPTITPTQTLPSTNLTTTNSPTTQNITLTQDIPILTPLIPELPTVLILTTLTITTFSIVLIFKFKGKLHKNS